MSPVTAIADLSDLLRALDQTAKLYGVEVWWRGHSDATWQLVPSVLRDPSVGPLYEKNITMLFQQRARTRHHGCPDDEDWPAWLFLMQHYRLPTRLLDWTESALVATYFAVNEKRDKDATLWALDPHALNEDQTGSRGLIRAVHDLVLPHLKGAFTNVQPPASAPTLALIADEVDQRMMMQLSAFTIHGSPQPLEAFAGRSKFVTSFTIPHGAKQRLFEQLFRLGIRGFNLFPDLEHLASDIAAQRYGPPASPA